MAGGEAAVVGDGLTKTRDKGAVVIIGAGIVGLSSAYFARRAAFDVTVIDRGDARGRASFGNAGVLAICDAVPLATPGVLKQIPGMMVSPSSPLKIRWNYLFALAPWLYHFVRSAMPRRVQAATDALASILSLASATHHEIASAAHAEGMLFPTGWLKANESERAFKNGAAERAVLADLGVPIRELESDAIDELVPGARGIFRRGALFTSCEQVRTPGAYVDAIAQACRDVGVRFVTGSVSGFDRVDGRIRAAITSSGPIDGDTFVVAAGAWSKDLCAAMGCKVPLDTERGYHLSMTHTGAPLLKVPLLWSEKSIVLSQYDDAIRMTSSVEFAGLRAPPDYRPIERTLSAVRKAMPGLKGAVERRWLGFRPSMPDSLPVIGRAPGTPNCVLAFGHGHLGLTLGPVTGRLVADELCGRVPKVDLRPFRVARF
jgi:D-amino-acid dehydrogenase